MEHYEILGLDLEVREGGLMGRLTGELGAEVEPFWSFFLTAINKNRVLATQGESNVYSLFLPPLPSKAGVRELKRKLLRRFFKRTIPCSLTFAVTYRCQADCIHCSSAHHRSEDRAELSTEECLKVIDQAIELGVITVILSGGEPLLRPDVFEIIAHVDKERAICNLFTNGHLLTEERVQHLKEAGLHSALVSLDSPDPQTHNTWRRVPGIFERAIEGLERAKRAGLLVGISTYITKEGLARGDHERMMALGKEIGVHEIVFFDTLPSGRFRDNRQELLDRQEKEQILAFTQKYLHAPGYPGIITQAWINNPKGSGCFAGNEQMYITAYGDVCPCDFTPLSFGNLRQTSLQQVWNRMISHEEYGQKRGDCRLQDPEFQRKYLDPIPRDVPLPFPV
ncbi:MAG: radical SAM protein [Nitrospinae bacterium]|nr:radical SAM protein [Nitrospinota bacterium]